MASSSLISAVDGYEKFLQTHRIDESVIDAYIDASKVAILTEKDIKYGLNITKRTKDIIDKFCRTRTGGTIWDLEKYSQQHEEEYSIVNKYYDVLLTESKEKFESFMLYLERKRPVEDRFYQNRINPLRQVANGIQELVDDELDELFVNCPSRIGKTQIVKLGFLWYGSKYPEKSKGKYRFVKTVK